MFYIKDLFVPLHHPSLQGHINFYYCRYVSRTDYHYAKVYKDILISTIVDSLIMTASACGLQGHINFYYCR